MEKAEYNLTRFISSLMNFDSVCTQRETFLIQNFVVIYSHKAVMNHLPLHPPTLQDSKTQG